MIALPKAGLSEAELAARDEERLLAEAWAAFNAGVRDRAARADGALSPQPTPLNRVVIQNWKAESGFVPIGNVELELEPGQTVTVWLDPAHATPRARERDDASEVHSSLAILCEDEPLVG